MVLLEKLSHTYRNEHGEIYKSVGELIEPYKPKFPSQLLAEQVAKKQGRTAEEVLAEWDLNKQASCDYGLSIHEAIELWVAYSKLHKLPHLALAARTYAEKLDRTKLFPEVRVYSDTYRVAGTIDTIESVRPGIVNIRDIKTNGELEEPKGKFLPPFQDIPYTKSNEYALKLSAYADLLEWMRPEVKVEKLILDMWNGSEWSEQELKRINLTDIWQTQSSPRV